MGDSADAKTFFTSPSFLENRIMQRFTAGRVAIFAALTIGLQGSAFAEATAQASSRTTTAEWTDPAIATLVLVDTLPAPGSANAGAVLIRRPGGRPNNIILVTRSTTPRDLSKAVTALAFSRRNQGDKVEREMRTAILRSPATNETPTGDDRRADRDLRRVVLAPEFVIPGIARGPAIVVRMSDSAVAKPGAKPTPARPPRR